MTSVEKVKKICRDRGIAISKLERELGFSNGYINGLKKGSFPAERIEKIARYLNIPARELISDEEESGYYTNPETAKAAQESFEDPTMRDLHHMQKNMDPETFKAHVNMMMKMYQLEHPEDDYDFTGC